MTRFGSGARLRTVLLAVVLAGSAAAHGATPAELDAAAAVDFRWGVRIPLRDGVQLNATLYRPHGQQAPRPCLFTLTPYISQSYHDRGMYFAAHGYPFLTVDVRGRGNSDGVFRPLIQEADDGYDVVEWLARQPYCNGKVSMWGGSYAGYDQWATARGRPPHLATIVPVAAPFAMIDFPGHNGIVPPYVIQWLTLTSGRAAQLGIFGDDAFWATAFGRYHETGAAFRHLDELAGNPSPIFQEWLAHPDLDAYWDAYNLTADDYARLEIPILSITGIYDGDQLGALEHYRRYMAATSAAGRARHFLVIGPWDHAGTRTPRDTVGGLKFGAASLVDLPQLHLDWYRWTMEGGPRPAFLAQPVAYYVTGAERWRYAQSLESITAAQRPLYLGSPGNAARSVFAPGRLGAAPAAGAPDSYRYDPAGPTMAAIEAAVEPGSLLDQRVQIANPAQVVYQSEPFAADTEVSGFFRLAAYIAIDQPDTDFVASIYEVTDDGRVILLTSDMLRARYRNGPRTPALVATCEPLRYEFSGFQFTSRLIARGSRLRLIVAASNSVGAPTNYNAGGVVADETAAVGRPVVVRLFHDAKHPSALSVPIAAAAP